MNKRDFSFKHSLTTLSVCSLLAFSSTAALAQTGDAPVWRTDLTGGETTTYALSDLAPGMAGKPVKLTGSNNSGYFDFTVKPDEVVTSGELTLNFTVSPSMLANVTQLNIFLNGELQQTAGKADRQAPVARLQSRLEVLPNRPKPSPRGIRRPLSDGLRKRIQPFALDGHCP